LATVPAVAKEACKDVDIVLHEAALGSVPRSVADPRSELRIPVAGLPTTTS